MIMGFKHLEQRINMNVIIFTYVFGKCGCFEGDDRQKGSKEEN